MKEKIQKNIKLENSIKKIKAWKKTVIMLKSYN